LSRSSCGNYRLGNLFQTVEECVVNNDLKFCGKSFSNSKNHGKSFAVFEVSKIKSSVPILNLVHEPENWKVGKNLYILLNVHTYQDNIRITLISIKIW